MKFLILLCFISLVWAAPLAAQPSLADSVRLRKATIIRTSSLVLSGWGAASLAGGWIGAGQTTGEAYHFHRTNAFFGGVNLLLGQLGFWTNRRLPQGQQSFPGLFREQERLEKLFLFNTALDVVYIVLGATSLDKGNGRAGADRERLRGIGHGLLLQGGFLLLYDGVLYLLHNRNGNRLNAYLNKLAVGPAPGGFGLVYRF